MSEPFPRGAEADSAEAIAAEATAQAHAEAALASLAGTLRVARVLAERQRPVELSGLDAQVGVVCAGILDLAPAQGRLLRPALLALRGELDALAAVLEAPA